MSARNAPSRPDHSDADITLYRLQACPYCERAVRKLKELDLDYHSRFVEPLHSKRNAVESVVGARTVPAIIDDNTGVAMAESANIVEYLEKTYGDEDGVGGRRDEGRRSDEDEEVGVHE